MFNWSAKRIQKECELEMHRQQCIYNERNKFKMTREEAAVIAGKNLGCPSVHAMNMISMLEKLGLIKFDEEIKVKSPSSIIADYLENNYLNGAPMISADKIINRLMQAGYLIVRKP